MNGKRIFRRDDVYITSPFGWRGEPIAGAGTWHDGVDYGTGDRKLPQYALADGVVINAGQDPSPWAGQPGGKFVFVRYDGLGYVAVHYHLDSYTVSTGQRVTDGTLIGYTGTTGMSTGIHLHFGWCPISKYTGSWKTNGWEDFEAYSFPGALPKVPTGAAFGIDTNSNQGDLDFEKIGAAGLAKFVIARTGYGDVPETQTDAHFHRFMQQSISNDMRVGAYHVSYAANLVEARSEAAMAVDLAMPYRDAINNGGLALFADIEEFCIDYVQRTFGVVLDGAAIRAHTTAYLDAFRAAGFRAGIYLNKNMWDSYYGDDYIAAERAKGTLIWYARPGFDDYTNPELHRGANIIQYASNPGPEYGYSGDIDKDVIIMDTPVAINGRRLYVEGPKAASCQYFATQSTDKAEGYLTPGANYELTYISATDVAYPNLGIKGPWVRFRLTAGGPEYWCLALDDRAALRVPAEAPVTPPVIPITPIDLGGLEQAMQALQQGLANLKQENSALRTDRDTAMAKASAYRAALVTIAAQAGEAAK